MLAPATPALVRATTSPRPAVTEALDAVAPYVERIFSPRASGVANLRVAGPALLVANHGGGVLAALEPLVFAHAIREALGDDAAMPRVLAHEALFRTPAADWLASVGAVRASPENARELLAAGEKVLVYPGGDREAFRPWSERHRVTLGDRRGYARTALEMGVPIVPVVSAGMHSGFVSLSDGRELAKKLPIARMLRVGVVPITLSFPFGVSLGLPAPYLPIDARVRIRILPALRAGRRASGETSCPERIDALHEEVLSRMQRAMDHLVRERRLERAVAIRRVLDGWVERLDRVLGAGESAPMLART